MKLFTKKNVENQTENKVKKEKKKIKARYIVVPVVGLLVVGVVVSSVVSANTPQQIACVNPYNEDVVKTIETSGTIASGEIVTYFAEADGTLATVAVETGDTISAGDLVYAYDEEELDKNIKAAQLKLSASENTYKDSVEKNQKNTEKNAAAVKNIDGIKGRLKELEKEQERLTNDIAYYQVKLAAEEKTSDGTLIDLQAKLKDVQVNIAGYEEMLAENKSDKASSEAAIQTEKELAALAANRNLEALTDNNTIDSLKAVKGGINSDVTGIVTDVKAVNGATVLKGTEICSIADSTKLYVSINLSKTDTALVKEGNKVDIRFGSEEYKGFVEKVNKVASKNESGSTIVNAKIAIDNPNEELIIGAEAKVKIYVCEEKGALVVPNECLSYDSEGAMVYVIEDGVLTTRKVEIGINNESVCQIKSGLSAADMVVTEDTSLLVEGMTAVGYTAE